MNHQKTKRQNGNYIEYAKGSFGGIQSPDVRPNDVTGISQKKQCRNGGMKVPHPLF